MPPRPKNRTKPSETKSNLLLSVEFCNLVTKSEGAPFETHVLLQNHWAYASNGVLSIAAQITEDIYAAPHNELISKALAKCGEQFSLTQLDNQRISIKSNKFKAIIPCIEPALITCLPPDPPLGVIDDRFKEAIAAVGVLATEGAQTVVLASVLMAGASVIATNSKILMEFWHGIDLPYGIALPKTFVNALIKCPKKLTQFGFSNSSATFYFEDNSWLKSQFFAQPWPDVKRILDRKCNDWPVPNEFWKGLYAIDDFSDSGDVHFDSGILRSHANENEGASYEIPGLAKGPVFAIDQLNIIRPYAKTIDFQAPGVHDHTTMLMFYGDNIRGCIAGRK